MLIEVDKMYIDLKTRKNHKSYTAINTLNNDVLEEKNYQSIIYRDLKLWITCFLTLILFNSMSAQNSFLENQLDYQRVRDAFVSCENNIQKAFEEKELTWPPKEIFIRSFKAELSLEIWVLEEDGFNFFKDYKVCLGSGTLGPKLQQGDGQVPEGFYSIDRFNPSSNFLLSLGINYPNKVDLIRTKAEDPGGDIFIHGSCVTIGCLPMTDVIMEEIYILSVLAKNSGQEDIPVHIYPYKFNFLNNTIFSAYPKHRELWKTLELEYEYFNLNKRIKSFYMSDSGKYILMD
jgi:murein L,D-transpeptidase YafK